MVDINIKNIDNIDNIAKNNSKEVIVANVQSDKNSDEKKPPIKAYFMTLKMGSNLKRNKRHII
ncbi:MAG: hypothetical protein Ta2D_13710 [Rickettsiales bacterium]|nr:MAG: hypothetical protein Ta2D_13710 [Rickettsiales bacterium]